MADLPEELVNALAGRYQVEREAAHGSMATVYLAHDLVQNRQVAIKVMSPKLATALGAGRFLREIKIAGSMAHPFIVPLYESGDANGRLFYVMPYLEGESLFDRLQRERRLPIDAAVNVTHEVAAALGYAHQRGILHRDVKPENILLSEGHAHVADFGLARAIGAADSRKLTETGVVVGTAYYMSPEQLREDPDLDQRADIYSLGCVLYEMITGGPPYTGPSLKELIMAILKAPIPSARRLQPAVPEPVDKAIIKALAKKPADRFSSMEEFSAALPL